MVNWLLQKLEGMELSRECFTYSKQFCKSSKEIPYKDEVVVDGEAVMEIHHYTYLKELKDIDLKKMEKERDFW